MSGRVLVVDDVATNRLLLRAKLSSAYYDVVVAENGTQALELARSEQPDMVMLDVMMPDMDGFEVCAVLKSQGRDRAHPGDHGDRARHAGGADPRARGRGRRLPVEAVQRPRAVRPGAQPDADEDDVRRAPAPRHDLARARARRPRLRAGGRRRGRRADPAGAAERRAGHGLGGAAARPAGDPDDRHPFRARGAEPRAARAARLLRRAPGARRGRRRAAARLGAARAAGDAAVGGDPRRRERRRADRGQGARPRGVGLHRGAVRRQRADRAHPLAAPAQALLRPAADQPPQRAEARGDRPADRHLQPPLRQPAHDCG